MPRYSQSLPRLEERLPVWDNPNPEIGVMFYVYGDIDTYIEEVFYAYRQLYRHTNIADVGKVHIFVGGGMMPLELDGRFDELGVLDIISYIHPMYNFHSGYIPLFLHREMRDCRYKLLLDSDMWLASNGHSPLDWRDLMEVWDQQPACTLFGESIRITEENISKQIGLTPIARNFLNPKYPEDRRAISGYFVGIRENAGCDELIHAFFESNDFPSDESFLQMFLHAHPEWNVYHTLGDEVPFANFENYPAFESTFFINVGMHEYGEYQKNKKDLLTLL